MMVIRSCPRQLDSEICVALDIRLRGLLLRESRLRWPPLSYSRALWIHVRQLSEVYNKKLYTEANPTVILGDVYSC